MRLGAKICLQTLELIIEADGHPATSVQPDDAGLKHAPKIFKETCQIDWSKPAKQVYDFVRGLSPYPGAWTTLRQTKDDGTVPQRLKIFRTTKTELTAMGKNGQVVTDRKHLYIACGDHLLQIDELQLAGKKRMDAAAFLNGMKEIENYFAE
jgi:methionyl-tRNA formyltransferase